MMKKIIGLVVVLALGFQPLCASGAQGAKGSQGGGGNTAVADAGRAKYVFLFIGDGMAMAQISAAEVFSTARASKDVAVTRLGFTQFPVAGLTTTYDLNLTHKFF
jgi:alkaline phosphatase